MHIKEAKTSLPVIEPIKKRWSPRSFSGTPIAQNDLNAMLEAATWAFSGGNLQPWFFLYAHKGTEGYNKIYDCLAPGNQKWAGSSAVLLVSLAKKERDPGKPNVWSKHDLGAANMLLVLQALQMNIYGHPMGGFDAERLIAELNIDSSVYEPVVCMALGYLGDPEELEESLRISETSERKRKSIEEISREI